jgi:hypothetical protein
MTMKLQMEMIWSAVASGARHRFCRDGFNAWEKRRRRCALPAHSIALPAT